MPRGVQTARNLRTGKARDIQFKDPGGEQAYGVVTKLLGNGRTLCTCDDGVERQCKIRGSMRRREWVHVNDVVLIALRMFSETADDGGGPGDILCRYTDAEAAVLRRTGEFDPETVKEPSEGGDDIVFDVDDV